MIKQNILIYGANGYTAELITDLAVKDGGSPILAGRSAGKIQALAKHCALRWRSFDLQNSTAVADNLSDVAVVLNCAGPFTRTAKVMAQACIATGVHYLDITGEVEVFESLAEMDQQAKHHGVMLMPGVGFDVVPSDCLAAHLKRRMPDALSLTLAFQAISRPSHGTATTMIENLHRGGLIRRAGKLTPVPAAWTSRSIDFGAGPVQTMSIPWGDVATAWFSTAIPNIEVLMAAPLGMRLMAKASNYLGGILGSELVSSFLKRQVDAGPAGPNEAQRIRGSSHLWGQVSNAAGHCLTSRLDTMEGYALTAKTAWDIAKRTLSGEVKTGFRTPSQVFGPDYILGFTGSKRIDL
jgi:short subunit dehydrogenase-like uncharacterized protein